MGLSSEDFEELDIGMCLDAMQEWIDQHTDKKEEKVRKATQADFDNF